MNGGLSSEQLKLQARVRELAGGPVAKRAAEVDRTEQYPWDNVELLKGEKLASSAEVGCVSAGICHLANISTRLRKTVELDPKAEAITNSPDANALVRRKYRPGHWAVPKNV